MYKKIYRIGGMSYYLKGGKFIPMAQDGQNLYDTVGSVSGQAANTSKNYLEDAWGTAQQNAGGDQSNGGMGMGQWGKLAGTAGNFLSSAGNAMEQNQGPIDPYVNQSTSNLRDHGAQDAVGTGMAALGAIPNPITQAISGFYQLGTGIRKVISPEDQYGVPKNFVAASGISPSYALQKSINIGKGYDRKGRDLKDRSGKGFASFISHGITGQKEMNKMRDSAINRSRVEEAGRRRGLNKGNEPGNFSVYAKHGSHLTLNPFYSQQGKNQPNVEIEDGEYFLGNPGEVTKFGKNVRTSDRSQFGAKFHGDKHGRDSDGDGMEGIPLKAPEGYVFSDYLSSNGKKVNKGKKGRKKQDGGMTVAEEVAPSMKHMSMADENSQDRYTNNPEGLANDQRNVEQIKNKAEQGKFMEDLAKQLKSKDRNFDEILNFIQESAPTEDMDQDQLTKLNGIVKKLGGKYQEGGMMPGQEQPQEQQGNPSNEHAMALQQQASMDAGMDPQVAQMFQQLPPEVQQQIMQMPVDQREIAIMNYFQQQAQGQQEQEMQEQPMGPEQMMEGANDPGMGNPMEGEQMQSSPVPEQVMQKFGGYNYEAGNKTNIDQAEMNKRTAHYPNRYSQRLNKQWGNHQNAESRFDFDHYQDGGVVNSQTMMNNGGGMTVGKRIMFQKGGRTYSGMVTGYDPQSGEFTLG